MKNANSVLECSDDVRPLKKWVQFLLQWLYDDFGKIIKYAISHILKDFKACREVEPDCVFLCGSQETHQPRYKCSCVVFQPFEQTRQKVTAQDGCWRRCTLTRQQLLTGDTAELPEACRNSAGTHIPSTTLRRTHINTYVWVQMLDEQLKHLSYKNKSTRDTCCTPGCRQVN